MDSFFMIFRFDSSAPFLNHMNNGINNMQNMNGMGMVVSQHFPCALLPLDIQRDSNVVLSFERPKFREQERIRLLS